MPASACVDVSMAALDLGEVVCVPTLIDAELLDRRAAIDEEIRAQSSGNGIPAERYAVMPRHTS